MILLTAPFFAKTTEDAYQDDVFAFQLAIYAAAAARGEGLKVEAAYIHELSTSTRKPVPVGPAVTKTVAAAANALIASVVQKQFPAKPEKTTAAHAMCAPPANTPSVPSPTSKNHYDSHQR